MPIIRNLSPQQITEANEEGSIQSSRRISKKLDLLDQKMDGL